MTMSRNLVAFLYIIGIRVNLLRKYFKMFLERIRGFQISMCYKISRFSILLSDCKPRILWLSQIPPECLIISKSHISIIDVSWFSQAEVSPAPFRHRYLYCCSREGDGYKTGTLIFKVSKNWDSWMSLKELMFWLWHLYMNISYFIAYKKVNEDSPYSRSG